MSYDPEIVRRHHGDMSQVPKRRIYESYNLVKPVQINIARGTGGVVMESPRTVMSITGFLLATPPHPGPDVNSADLGKSAGAIREIQKVVRLTI